MGGLKLAYRAFLAWYTDKEGAAPPRQEQQLVFIAFGQNWCDKEQVSRFTCFTGTKVVQMRQGAGIAGMPQTYLSSM
jgi:hypothetical protein